MKSFHVKIRTKLFIGYSCAFFLILLIFGLGNYFFVRFTIEDNIESELEKSTDTLLSMVETAAEVSLKNYLRATAEKNLEISKYFHQRVLSGDLHEEEAKQRAAAIFLHQHIGQSGYTYVIDSHGVLQTHPKASLVGVDISSYDFVDQQKSRKNGYLAYDWQNPGERSKRPKALYMTYFPPWDWIISVTAYRSEFRQLVNVDDFKDKVLALTFGKTGYSYVMDLQGNLVIHPKLAGHNIYQEQDATGRYFIQEICRRKEGKIIYPWQNPGDPRPREKLVIFKHIPQFDWIVASSSYLNEFFAPLNTIQQFMIGAVVAALPLLLLVTLAISRTITAPLYDLMSQFAKTPDGNFTSRINKDYGGEFGDLAGYFNQFMTRLEDYSNDLKREIGVRKETEEALRQSEEMSSKAFSLSPIGILILSYPKGKIVSVNDSFVDTTGYSRLELTNHTLVEKGICPSQEDLVALYHQLTLHKSVREQSLSFFTRNGDRRQALVSADLIQLWGDTYILAVMEDITERQQLQERILDISEMERRKIGQDIHDDLCPHLIGTEVMAKILAQKLEIEGSEHGRLAGKVHYHIQDSISKSRVLARGLCPVFLVDRGLEAAIDELALRIEEMYAVSCRHEVGGHFCFHDTNDIAHVFLIVQEAVTNCARHAEAKTILIKQEAGYGKARLIIEDDGKGFSRRQKSVEAGMGQKIMRYRAERIGAELTIARREGGGTRVTLALAEVSIEQDNEEEMRQ